ncbi:FeoB-associated Cys-rich membrane protein [Enterococcus sp. MJM12]|uniref:FeoB-associated Cys-rich membrane protein n=1 Tax=Candidatus Enterococcus myersii TaxID=2815322 RepID=A0ABS3H4A3_9ENTE|nr:MULTISPECIES: FeoB-associated Cys-rich membrane protein [Enterococcus]MBO0448246.1 FeoB-associated Cys-rich membrane protein [Enterococcus sp. MJM12]MDT2739424.1 FeoB-associated Cys-rich membrane protein [Enterococcus canintestini]WHA09863.1 FeoB-associated Cys-rich membrane protein [Enterococcus montenegrensis]
MVATIILSLLIFGAAAFVVYRQVKKGSSCEDCKTSCPVKKPEQF